MDCSLPGSSVHGIFQARVLEWGAIAFSQALVLSKVPELKHNLQLLGLHFFWLTVLMCDSVPSECKFLSLLQKDSETKQRDKESKARVYLSKDTLSEGEQADR